MKWKKKKIENRKNENFSKIRVGFIHAPAEKINTNSNIQCDTIRWKRKINLRISLFSAYFAKVSAFIVVITFVWNFSIKIFLQTILFLFSSRFFCIMAHGWNSWKFRLWVYILNFKTSFYAYYVLVDDVCVRVNMYMFGLPVSGLLNVLKFRWISSFLHLPYLYFMWIA